MRSLSLIRWLIQGTISLPATRVDTAKLRREIASSRPDVLWCLGSFCAELAGVDGAISGILAVVDLASVEGDTTRNELRWALRQRLSARSAARIARTLLDGRARRRIERRVLRSSDLLWVCSERDLEVLDPPIGSTVHVVPNGSVVPDEPIWAVDRNRPPGVLLCGNFGHGPNEEAALWLLDEVMPRLEARTQGVSFDFVGVATKTLLSRASERVRVHGYVEDLTGRYAEASVVAAPIRSGSGTKTKVIEAMAMGAPLVTTSVGIEGLDAQPGRDLIVADTPDAFAEAIAKLISAPETALTLGRNAHSFARVNHDWHTIAISASRTITRLLEPDSVNS